MEKETKIFGEIYLDTDTDPKINKGSDYILNSIIQSDARFGMIVNSKGNSIITDQNLFDTIFGINNFIALGQTTRNWSGLTVNANSDVYAAVYDGDIYKQTAGTGNFIALGLTNHYWMGLAAHPNGNIYATDNGLGSGDIYVQKNGVGDFIALSQPLKNWMQICVAPNGNVYACAFDDDIYMQTAGVGNFIALGQTTRYWVGITAAPNGDIYATNNTGDIYKQTAGTGNFIALSQTSRNWQFMATGQNGYIYATVFNGDIYVQKNGVGNFIALGQTTRNWRGITVNNNGDIYAGVSNGDIYMREPVRSVKVLTSCNDDARKRIIYFTVNYTGSSYYSAIFYYETDTRENKLILNADYLNFTYDSNITANIVGDFLLWTDGVNPPRKINYIRAYNYTNSISTDYTYSTLSSDIIEAYKRPPSVPISGGSSFSINQTTSLLNGSYQFAYRYVYTDYEKSVLSPYSDIFFAEGSSFADGSKLIYSNAYAISIYFYLYPVINNTYDDIDSLELFVRNSDAGNWYLYDKIYNPKLNSFSLTYYSSGSFVRGGTTFATTRGTVTQTVYNKLTIGIRISYNSNTYDIQEKFISGSSYIIGFSPTLAGTGWTYTFTITGFFNYYFYDDKVKQEVDQTDLLRPYDFLPILAGTQEFIEKDKIIYGDITEGFDNTNADIDFSIITNTLNIDSPSINGIVSFIGTPHQYLSIRFNSYVPDQLYYIQIFYSFSSTQEDVPLSVSYKSVSGDTEQTIIYMLWERLRLIGITNANIVINSSPSYRYIRINCKVTKGYPGIGEGYSPQYNSANAYYIKPHVKTLKDNDSYLGAIRYYDKNLRFSSENRFYNQINTPTSTYCNEIYSLQCFIKNKPPLNAYYYSLDFTKRIKNETFIRLFLPGYYYGYFGSKDAFLRLKINKAINDAIDSNKNLNLKTYIFEPGDRIKVFGLYGGYISGSRKFNVFRFDVEIKGEEWPETDDRYQKDYATSPSYILDANNNKIDNLDSQVIIIPLSKLELVFSIAVSIIVPDMMIEIYRPKKQSSNPFYYPAYFGTIGNPGTSNNYHNGTSQNQNPNSPASISANVECNPGDVYYKLRYANFLYPALDANYSDYYESNNYGYGLPNIFDIDAKQEELTSALRNSGSLLEDTKVNRLNVFKSEDIEILKSKFGTIHSLQEIGNVLKVLQDKKETSIYISRTEMQNADNTSNVVKSTALLGTANIMMEDRGTIYKKSVIPHNRNLYYFDVYRGEVIRTSANGQYPISEYGMRTYFKNKAKEILDTGTDQCDVIAGFDEENKIYLLTFIISGNSETIGFYDPEIEGAKPHWISFYSFIPECYSTLGISLITFYQGLGYIHNSNNVNRCTFYGIKYKQQINWYSNILPTIKKIYRSLIIKSNNAWKIPNITSEADSTYIRGIQSLLKSNHFILREGIFYAPYLNNMLTTSATASIVDLINGDTLRAYYLKHEMENTENAETWLIDCEIQIDPSNKF